MMKKFSSLACPFGITVLSFLLWFAGASTGSARDVSCRFLFPLSEPPSLFAPTGGDNQVRIEAFEGQISEAVNCAVDDDLLIFTDSIGGKPQAQARVPVTAVKLILVFIPLSKPGSLPYSVMVIEDSATGFPDGGGFIANFQPQEIRFILGEHKLMLRSGATHAVTKPMKVDSFNMAPILFEFRKEEKWRTASESMMRFVPGLRYLMLCYLDPQSGRPIVSTFQDRAL